MLTKAKRRVYAPERKLAGGLSSDEELLVRRWLVHVAASLPTEEQL
jgi:hypothetical protein